MFIRDAIQQTLADYDNQKRWFRVFADPAIIKTLRALLIKIESELEMADSGFIGPRIPTLNKALWTELLSYFSIFKKIIDKIDIETNKETSITVVSALAKNLFGEDYLENIDDFSASYNENKALDLLKLLEDKHCLTLLSFQKILNRHVLNSIHQLFYAISMANANNNYRYNGHFRSFSEHVSPEQIRLVLSCNEKNIAGMSWILARFVVYHKIYQIDFLLQELAGYNYCNDLINKLRKLSPEERPDIRKIIKKVNLEFASGYARVLGEGFRNSHLPFFSLPLDILKQEIYPRLVAEFGYDKKDSDMVFDMFSKKPS